MVYWQKLFCYSSPICNTTRHVRTRRPLSARTRNWFPLVPRFSLSMIFSNTLRRLELHSSESTANFFTKEIFLSRARRTRSEKAIFEMFTRCRSDVNCAKQRFARLHALRSCSLLVFAFYGDRFAPNSCTLRLGISFSLLASAPNVFSETCEAIA